MENGFSQSGLGCTAHDNCCISWERQYALWETSLLQVLCSVPWSVHVNSYGPLFTAFELSYEVTSRTSGQNRRCFTWKSCVLCLFCLVNVVAILHDQAWHICAKMLSATERSLIIQRKDLKMAGFLKDFGWSGLLTQLYELVHKIT